MNKNNSFGALRLLAALMVVLSHSYPIALGSSFPEPPSPMLDLGCSLGTVGVYLFFAISGILVTKSFIERKSVIHFAVYRVLRIYPAIIVCLIFTTFIIGPIFSNTPGYLVDLQIYQHFLHNSMLITNVYSSLPGVFANNPLPFAINNSIWTLVWELRAYSILLVGGTLLGVKRSWPGSALILILVAFSPLFISYDGRQANFLFAFFFGGLLFQLRERFIYRYSILALFSKY